MKWLVSVLKFLCINIFGTLATLPEPHIGHIRTYNTGIEVQWDPVKSSNPSDPVIGYKVSAWEPEYRTVYVFKNVNGTSQAVATREPVEDEQDIRKVPTRVPAFVVVTNNKNHTYAFIAPVKKGIMYDIRTQAFTDTEMGPLSVSLGVGLSIGASAGNNTTAN